MSRAITPAWRIHHAPSRTSSTCVYVSVMGSSSAVGGASRILVSARSARHAGAGAFVSRRESGRTCNAPLPAQPPASPVQRRQPKVGDGVAHKHAQVRLADAADGVEIGGRAIVLCKVAAQAVREGRPDGTRREEIAAPGEAGKRGLAGPEYCRRATLAPRPFVDVGRAQDQQRATPAAAPREQARKQVRQHHARARLGTVRDLG